MKKYLNTSLVYAILALAAGVFFREFTKANSFTGSTMLRVLHPHLFLLGTVIFLIAALFSRNHDYPRRKSFKAFFVVYNIGLSLTAVMMLVRGILQVLGTALPSWADSTISGVAGIGHITTAVGIIIFLLALRKTAKS